MRTATTDATRDTPASMIDGDIRRVLITGANSGIGFAAGQELACSVIEIVMVCRDSARGERALAEVADVAPGLAPALLLADLSSQREVRAVAAEVRERCERTDVLLNNAGGAFERRELSAGRIEKTLATNHLAPFLPHSPLLDLLLAGPAARIVAVASEAFSVDASASAVAAHPPASDDSEVPC